MWLMFLGKLEYLMAKSVFLCFPSFILRVLACDHVAAPNVHASFTPGSARSSFILSSDQCMKVMLTSVYGACHLLATSGR